MRRLFLTLGALFLALPLLSQDEPQDRPDEKELLRRTEVILREETQKLSRELAEMIRREFATLRTPEAPAAERPSGELATITADALRRHVEFLASDELLGRQAGYPGNDRATEYVAEIFEKAGLKPVGDEGTYFQKFSVGKRSTRNCLGLLEGSDPVLKKEIVVLGGHHDHVGSDDEGKHFGRVGGPRDGDGIWNGADDNASGTSAVLEIARAFGEGRVQPKRSVLLMTFSAEEGGLIGSRYYTQHPIAPMSDHIFMLNLDMIGRNPNRAVEIHGVGSAADGALRTATDRVLGRTGLKAKVHDVVKMFGGDSDHTSFSNKGVPFAFFFTGLHGDYHQVTDHADKLSYDNMERIARAAAMLVLEIADAPERLRYSEGASSRLKVPGLDEQAAPKYRLGVNAEPLDEAGRQSLKLPEGEGGIVLSTVMQGSVAEGIGLQVGDIVTHFAGKPLPEEDPLGELRNRLNQVKEGAGVKVMRVREGKSEELTATWEKTP